MYVITQNLILVQWRNLIRATGCGLFRTLVQAGLLLIVGSTHYCNTDNQGSISYPGPVYLDGRANALSPFLFAGGILEVRSLETLCAWAKKGERCRRERVLAWVALEIRPGPGTGELIV